MERYLKKFKEDSGRQGQEDVERSEYPDVQPSVSGQQPGKNKPSDLSQHDDDLPSDEDPVIPVIAKKNYTQKFRDSWLKEKSFSTWLVRNPSKCEEPFCQLCAKSIRGCIVMHKKRLKSASDTPRVTMFYNKNKEDKMLKQIKSAEMKLVAFVAEHNLSFSVLNHLPQLIASVCPDSGVAKKLKCCRKKGTKITKDLMRSENIYNLSKKLKKCEFSLIIDESTDISSVKNLAMVVRFYDKEMKKVHDAFLALLEVQDTGCHC
ncbi:unnamed protein product [Phaedon cochleariae]|uniref:DUF4371 domain-containing protein n=1 Tax=Phaedon cochleariae TaxID=80249 RepID=A0A9N9X495_PHACE|nr:unnamed protein product [Phaedon cochleariae]